MRHRDRSGPATAEAGVAGAAATTARAGAAGSLADAVHRPGWGGGVCAIAGAVARAPNMRAIVNMRIMTFPSIHTNERRPSSSNRSQTRREPAATRNSQSKTAALRMPRWRRIRQQRPEDKASEHGGALRRSIERNALRALRLRAEECAAPVPVDLFGIGQHRLVGLEDHHCTCSDRHSWFRKSRQRVTGKRRCIRRLRPLWSTDIMLLTFATPATLPQQSAIFSLGRLVGATPNTDAVAAAPSNVTVSPVADRFCDLM